MAILKYTTAEGQTVKLNSYKVNNLVPQQEKGDNPDAVMSQKAVTEEVNEIGLQIDEVTGQITALNTALGTKASKSDLTSLAEAATADLDAISEVVEAKANADNVYTKDEADGKYLTATSSSFTGKADKSEVSAVDAKADQNASDITALTQTVSGKADSSQVYDKEYIDEVVEQVNTSLNSKLPIESFNEWSEGVAEKTEVQAETTRATAKEGELETAIGTKAASADLTAEISRAQSAESDLSDRIDELENDKVIDCGEY